jgi:hypothetical protein
MGVPLLVHETSTKEHTTLKISRTVFMHLKINFLFVSVLFSVELFVSFVCVRASVNTNICHRLHVRLDILMAVSLRRDIFWNMTLCSVVGKYQTAWCRIP